MGLSPAHGLSSQLHEGKHPPLPQTDLAWDLHFAELQLYSQGPLWAC